MKSNIHNTKNHKQELINKHLRYLYESKSSSMLKIQAIEFLYPYKDEDNILDKLKFFYDRERDTYIKTLLRQAINGQLQSYLMTDFKNADSETTNPGSFTNTPGLSSRELAMLRVTNL